MTETFDPSRHVQLPMAHLTHGNRSAVTCHLRCGDACAVAAPNTTDTTYFREVAGQALSRRRVLGTGAVAAGLLAGGALVSPAAAGRPRGGHGKGRRHPLEFAAIAPVAATVDDVSVPTGYRWDAIIRWGDPILRHAPDFDPAAQTPEAQAGQFGYNNDYLDVIETNRSGTRAILVCNHEYTNENIMFPPGTDAETVIRTAWAAHGLSVVELGRTRRGDTWSYVRGARLNRRITLDTEFELDGPAAGSALLRTAADPTGRRVRGTMNNCAGGTTPWGTVLSGEENFNQYFRAAGTDPKEARYGLSSSQDSRNWRSVDPRWDATTAAYAHEPNRFGWVVEIDPADPRSTPVKHTAMGRFKHEGANVTVNRDGRVVTYLGDDERFDYLYRFVSKERIRRGGSRRDHRHNLRLLSEGDLSVARFSGDGLEDGVSDGSGEWLPLTRDGRSMVPGFSLDEVLVYTRLAADAVQPTKMDRPEDVEPNPVNGKVYVACTNNTDRGKAGKEGPTESNPRAANKDGHVVEITPARGDHTARTFTWSLLLVCGDPATAGTYFGGWEGEVSPISCPDNVAFDSEGNLWISTDGQPSALTLADGLFKVPVSGRERGHVQQFLAVPAGAETCGPVIHDRDGSVFVAVQHPGEDGTWEAPQSRFPDFVPAGGRTRRGAFAGPRPAVVQVSRGGGDRRAPVRGRGR
ncbi:PhoX family phosphatase [Nocardioides sp. YIM 152315]|uniref:PhoX family protein n=1 Tax=Nocardioides sp. YIM 152315 TaxID=3031760 RepID=UPI0023D9EBC7|nr:PhoX family phosphatase [Nocardioides sp. YIM 152315]MDF1604185.1 PhoX family phosphatase [Nocardioides sp. YIM 152315]